jgi:hypothetical protein
MMAKQAAMQAMNIGGEFSKKSSNQYLATPWFCALLSLCLIVLLHISSNLLMTPNPPRPASSDLVQPSFLPGSSVKATTLGGFVKETKKDKKEEKEVIDSIAKVRKDFDAEAKALSRGDIKGVKDLEKQVGHLLKKARRARSSFHLASSDDPFDSQLDALEEEERKHEYQATSFALAGANLKNDASARDRANQLVQSEEHEVKEGMAAMGNAKHAREREEQLLKEENELVKKAEQAFKHGDRAAATKYAGEFHDLENKEQAAERDAKAAGARAHELERQGLRQSRKDWENVYGAAFPDLGHDHVKVEDERLKLKHLESDFEERQKKDEEKQKKTIDRLSELAKKVQIGEHVGSAV